MNLFPLLLLAQTILILSKCSVLSKVTLPLLKDKPRKGQAQFGSSHVCMAHCMVVGRCGGLSSSKGSQGGTDLLGWFVIGQSKPETGPGAKQVPKELREAVFPVRSIFMSR